MCRKVYYICECCKAATMTERMRIECTSNIYCRTELGTLNGLGLTGKYALKDPSGLKDGRPDGDTGTHGVPKFGPGVDKVTIDSYQISIDQNKDNMCVKVVAAKTSAPSTASASAFNS
ncbi:uncharacterized protein DFL_003230 [Arthrobotrys flagrans]|uniref:Uncharacterized protein n=1 Tax=Arthrobotrys flagrans TaxID=97331 RepID=A0A437A190_ARTFL|nr:hypothetical protein DFL_003230 [Arthrobotrys flagrans]